MTDTQNRWQFKVYVDLSDKETFEQKRDEYIRAIRASRWFTDQESDELETYLEDLADTENGDEFDETMHVIYGMADWDRAWFEVTH